MKTKYVLSSALLFVACCLLPVFSFSQTASPEVIASAGDHFTSPSGSVSWTIGEPVTDTYYGAVNILTKGFHQPATLSLTSVPDMDLNGSIYAYPNPVINNLVLDFSKMDQAKYSLDIYDATGQVIINRKIVIDNELHKEIFALDEFRAGLYFIKIRNESSEKNKIFRIIKQ